VYVLSFGLRLGISSDLRTSGFPNKVPYIHSSSLHACYMPYPYHPPWLDHYNYTWIRAQVTKPLIMQFSPWLLLYQILKVQPAQGAVQMRALLNMKMNLHVRLHIFPTVEVGLETNRAPGRNARALTSANWRFCHVKWIYCCHDLGRPQDVMSSKYGGSLAANTEVKGFSILLWVWRGVSNPS
jgi:hypothetical protein